jgi:hypothetical protein
VAVAATAAQAMRTEIVVSGRMTEYANAESQSARLSAPQHDSELLLRRRPTVVDFDQTNASAVVHSRQQRRVKARW